MKRALALATMAALLPWLGHSASTAFRTVARAMQNTATPSAPLTLAPPATATTSDG